MTEFDHDYPKDSDSSIRVASGGYIDLINPKRGQIYLEDIAHGLSQICRFGGHTAQFYSVAEHSLHVAAFIGRQTGDPTMVKAALLHDASEAYLGDMVRPLKHHPKMAAYREIEAAMEEAIAEEFEFSELGVNEKLAIKAVDNNILRWEMAMFRDNTWRTPNDPVAVRLAFIEAFDNA